MKTTLISLFLSIIPISELRGAIPYAYFNGINIFKSYLIGVCGNLCVIPAAFIFLALFEKIIMKIDFLRDFLMPKVEKVRKEVNKYGYIGLSIFVAIPLPITGAWTGCLGAWFLGMDKKKSSLAIALGVLTAGLIVSIVIFTGSSLASIFTKTVNI